MWHHQNKYQMLHSISLSTTIEFNNFREIYHGKNGETVSVEYLARCATVKAFINENGDWVAGYCVNYQPNFRYLETFGDYLKKMILRDKDLKEGDLVEIACIWMNREVLKDEMKRLNVYFTSLEDALSTEKGTIMGGSKIMSVWKNFEIPLPHEMYFGIVPFAEKPELGKIVYASSQELKSFMKNQVYGFIHTPD